MFLQAFGFKNSTYERPHQKWTCGRIREGKGCNAGPTPDGKCGATFECFPQRNGDRWTCTRDALDGGKCKAGPGPDGACSRPLTHCLPICSLRSHRGSVVKWTLLAITGLVLIVLADTHRERLFSAGDLSFAHSAEAIGCNACHSAAEVGFQGWVMAALASPSTRESHLCISCHPVGKEPLNAHGLPEDVLAGITEQVKATGGGLTFSAIPGLLLEHADKDGKLSCVRCHAEHRGHEAQLTGISDVQCQACHVTRFDSLEGGHPSFGRYPFDRRTRIIFDHDSHRGKYYPDKDQAFECAQCHTPDLTGESMLVASFENACADCHAAEIQGAAQSGDKGIAVLAIPGLDLEFVKERGLAIGEWPEDAEAEAPPLMQILLSADPAYRESAQTLADLDLLDLSGADDQAAAAVEVLAWSVKGLLEELALGGQEALQARLETVFGVPLGTSQLAGLSGMLSADGMQRATAVWFPNLADEISRHRRGEPVKFRFADVETTEQKTDDEKEESEEAPGDLWVTVESDEDQDKHGDADEPGAQGLANIPADETAKAGGWYREYFTLFYRPAGHEDRFYRQWLDSTAAALPANPSGAIEASVKMLTADETPGRCVKCHSVDRDQAGVLAINWHAKRPQPAVRTLTRFSHRSHLSLTGDKGCLHCHAWREQRPQDFLEAYDGADPYIDNSNFQNMDKAVCVECHRPDRVSDACLTCHYYHAGEIGFNISGMTETVVNQDSSDGGQ